MIKKRILAIMLAAACTFSFAACGSDKQEASAPSAEDQLSVESIDEGTTDSAIEGSSDAAIDTETETNAEPSTPAKEPASKPAETTPEKPAANSQSSNTSAQTGSSSNASSGSTSSSQTETAKPQATKADAQAYIGSSVSALKSAIGQPSSSSYSSSCMGEGEDGELRYNGFTVYTYKEGGQEKVTDVE